MLAEHIASQIYENFAFEPTPAQKNAIERLGGFLCGDAQDRIFIPNGYAGTGKDFADRRVGENLVRTSGQDDPAGAYGAGCQGDESLRRSESLHHP